MQVKNQFYMRRYEKFILAIRQGEKPKVVEKHHIIPVCVRPDLAKCKDNIIEISPKAHYLCHWMLAKAYGGKLWFAWNMMKRVGNTGILYEMGRKYVSETVSNTNKGRKHQNSTSKPMKGKVTVRDSEGKTFSVPIDDPRYISGEFKFYRVGFKHKEETKARISESNKGKTVTITESHADAISKSMSKLIWVTDIATGKYLRIPPENFNPTTQEKGRKGFRGFDYINSRRKIIIDT